MPECGGCGAHVSAAFGRVMSDGDGEIHACLECASRSEVFCELQSAGIEHGVVGGGIDVQ